MLAFAGNPVVRMPPKHSTKIFDSRQLTAAMFQFLQFFPASEEAFRCRSFHTTPHYHKRARIYILALKRIANELNVNFHNVPDVFVVWTTRKLLYLL